LGEWFDISIGDVWLLSMLERGERREVKGEGERREEREEALIDGRGGDGRVRGERIQLFVR
jgi:hypothetical protein